MRKIAILPLLLLLVACHKDNDINQISDKRIAQIASSTYINESDDHTQGWAGRGDVIWKDSAVVSFCGEAIEYNDDTISIYYTQSNLTQGNLKRRAYIRNGRIARINTGDLYT